MGEKSNVVTWGGMLELDISVGIDVKWLLVSSTSKLYILVIWVQCLSDLGVVNSDPVQGKEIILSIDSVFTLI